VITMVGRMLKMFGCDVVELEWEVERRFLWWNCSGRCWLCGASDD
jgi:hypothetical protein